MEIKQLLVVLVALLYIVAAVPGGLAKDSDDDSDDDSSDDVSDSPDDESDDSYDDRDESDDESEDSSDGSDDSSDDDRDDSDDDSYEDKGSSEDDRDGSSDDSSDDESDDSSDDDGRDDDSWNGSESFVENAIFASAVTGSEARAIALEAAKGSVTKVEQEIEEGRLIWKVKLDDNGVRREVRLDAQTGQVLRIKSDDGTDIRNDPVERVLNSTSRISSSEAISIARNYLNGTVDRVEQEYEDGILVWKVRFDDAGVRSEVRIDAETGRIVQKESSDDILGEIRDLNSNVSLAEALEIAKVEADGAIDKVEQEFEEGKLVWKVKLDDNGVRTDVRIDAETGEVLRVKTDEIDLEGKFSEEEGFFRKFLKFLGFKG